MLVGCGTPTPSPVPSVIPRLSPTPVKPVAKIGDTLPEVGVGISKHQLAMALLSWRESEVAVNGPYFAGDYYVFTAKPGMKFIVLYYQFTNNWVREQETPYVDAGEILTAPKGYYYKVWSPSLGVSSTEYKPRKATQDEVKRFGGDSGAFKRLMPEESTEGRVVFEIPEDSEPLEAKLAYVPLPISLTD